MLKGRKKKEGMTGVRTKKERKTNGEEAFKVHVSDGLIWKKGGIIYLTCETGSWGDGL